MAASAVDFYAYWNGALVADLWRAVASATDTTDYHTLIASAAIFGFLCVITGAALRNRGFDVVSWFAAVILIYAVCFIPRVNVAVKDDRAGSVEVVQNVPLGIAWPAATVSQVSHWLTLTLETAFSDVSADKVTQFGVAFPQRAVTALVSAGPVTAPARDALQALIARCVMPELVDNPAKKTALMQSSDIVGLISGSGWLNPARRVLISGKVMTCAQAPAAVTNLLATEEIPALERILLAQFGASPEDWTGMAILNALPEAEQLLLGTSRTLSQSLQQSVLMSALPDGLMTAAAKSGAAPLSAGVALARAQGNLASEISYRTLADMAQSALPKLRASLQFVVIGLFPIVFVLIAGTGLSGLGLIRAYLTLLISVELWMPITTIIHYLTLHVDAEPMNRLVAATGGVTVASAALIREAGASSQAMAGSLMWLVPVIAYGIAKGSDIAITQMASSVLSPASQAGSAQSSSVAMGNISTGNASVGNVSANNTNANKHDTSVAYASPTLQTSSGAFGTWTADSSTGRVTSMTVANTNLGVSAGAASASVVSASAGHSVTAGYGWTDSTTTSSTNGYTSVTGVNDSHVTGVTATSGSDSSYAMSSSDSYQTGTSRSSGQESSWNSGASTTETFGIKSGLNSGGDLKGQIPLTALPSKPLAKADAKNATEAGAKEIPENSMSASGLIGAAIGASGTSSGGYNDTTGYGMKVGATDTSAHQNSYNTSFTANDNASLSSSLGATLSDTRGATLTDGTSTATAGQDSVSAHTTDSVTTGTNNASELRSGADLSPMIRDTALAAYGSPAEALEALNADPGARAALSANVARASQAYRSEAPVTPPAPPVPARRTPRTDSPSKTYEADAHGIRAAYDDAVEGTRDTGRQWLAQQPAPMDYTGAEQSDLILNTGLTRATDALFRNREAGWSNVVMRAVNPFRTYESPGALFHDLETKAQTNPKLHDALIRIGSQGVSMSDEAVSKELKVLK